MGSLAPLNKEKKKKSLYQYKLICHREYNRAWRAPVALLPCGPFHPMRPYHVYVSINQVYTSAFTRRSRAQVSALFKRTNHMHCVQLYTYDHGMLTFWHTLLANAVS